MEGPSDLEKRGSHVWTRFQGPSIPQTACGEEEGAGEPFSGSQCYNLKKKQQEGVTSCNGAHIGNILEKEKEGTEKKAEREAETGP